MIDIKWDIVCSAVDALAAEFFKQILRSFATSQLSLLILNPFNFRVLGKLRIELYKLLADSFQQGYLAQSRNPRKNAVWSMLQGRSKPPLCSPCGSGTGVSGNGDYGFFGCVSNNAPLVECIANLLTSMLKIDKVQKHDALCFLFPH